jgi:hypothetical protein
MMGRVYRKVQLKDILIMEVPSGALKKVVRNKGIDTKLSSAEEMATAIADQDSSTGIDLANEFKYAGSTAVNLNIVMRGIPSEWYNKEYFKDKLIEKFSPAIFNGGIRPTLDKVPKLISAHETGTKLVLAFSFLGPARRYLDDFQIVSRSPQIVEYVIIHFSPFAVEVRASHEQNTTFRNSVIDIMGLNPSDVAWEKATKLTEEHANELAKRLGARLRAAKHKMIEGPYATKEVTAHTQIADLEADEQYKQEFSNQPMKKKTLIFDYTYSFGYQDVISYVVTDEGLWIRSKAGEEVISHVLNKIIEIRYATETENGDEEEFDDSFSEMVEEEHIGEQLAIDLN